MKVLLVGHQGFLGTGLADYFQRNGHTVVGWGSRENLFNLTAAYLEENAIELVVNLSAAQDRSTTQYNLESPEHQINALGTDHLVRIMRGTPTRFIQISTKDIFGGNVYGPEEVKEEATRLVPLRLIREDEKFAPETIYAKSKLIAEFFAEAHSQANIIRLSSCYTDFYHRRANWMVRILMRVLAGEPVQIVGDGKQVRDPLHTDDLGRLIEQMCDTNRWGHIVHAGGGSHNMIAIGEYVQSLGADVQIEQLKGVDRGFAFDNGLAHSLFGWDPEFQVHSKLPVLIENVKCRVEN